MTGYEVCSPAFLDSWWLNLFTDHGAREVPNQKTCLRPLWSKFFRVKESTALNSEKNVLPREFRIHLDIFH